MFGWAGAAARGIREGPGARCSSKGLLYPALAGFERNSKGSRMTISMTASLVMAAGRGSRMEGYAGNKTLLPLLPEDGPFVGRQPLILEILKNLPAGPKAIVVHHREAEVREATRHLDVTYCRQPELNGTGGALIAAAPFIEKTSFDALLITMGDVPLVEASTYGSLADGLAQHPFMVLGFKPREKRRYGLVEMGEDRVMRITEWTYWKDYPPERQKRLTICNAGIYAVRREVLGRFLPVLKSCPHRVEKQVNGAMKTIEEYFITDLVDYLNEAGLTVGCRVVCDENEVMGVDDPESLRRAQKIYAMRRKKG